MHIHICMYVCIYLSIIQLLPTEAAETWPLAQRLALSVRRVFIS